MTASVTRRYRFSASHRLHARALSDAENAQIFGKCNNPYGHGHDYELEVTVRGAVNPESGLVAPLAALDRHIQTKVLSRLASKNINKDVVDFESLVPTTENLTLVIAQWLEADWPFPEEAGGPKILRIHLQETGRNGFELVLAGREPALSDSALAEALALSPTGN